MLKINNLNKSYRKNKILNNISLSVRKGEIKALVGANGAGKSTLVDIVCGVKKADNGSIVINGVDISHPRDRQSIKFDIGYMPQIFNLYLDLTVKENLNYLRAIFNLNDKQIVDELIKVCNLESKSNTLAKHLSGGYKQLLCLAGALINNPKFLILDEPTSAMDPVFRTIFWNIIKSYQKQGVTVFVITHHLEELLECDSFACLSGGDIIFDGSVQKFKSGDFINIKDIMSKFYKRKKV